MLLGLIMGHAQAMTGQAVGFLVIDRLHLPLAHSQESIGIVLMVGAAAFALGLALAGPQAAGSALADGGSDRLVDAIVAWGSEEKIASRVAEHHAAGADHVCVQVLMADPRTAPTAEFTRLAPALLG